MLQQKQLITTLTNPLKAANDDLLAIYSELNNEEQNMLAIVINSTITVFLRQRGE